MSARTIRYYTSERVLPATEFRGRATRYVREHLICLVAINALRRTHRWSLHKRFTCTPVPARRSRRWHGH